MIGRRILFAIVAACFALMPQSASAQRKVAVEVSHRGNDSVGSRLAYQVKEGIRRSAGLRLVKNNESRLIIHLMTLDVFRDHPGTATVYSYVITGYLVGVISSEIYLKSELGNCGAKRVTEVAEELIGDIDQMADGLGQEARSNFLK